MMMVRTRWFLLIAVVAFAVALFLLRKPVWFSFTDLGELQPSFVVFNPLRNHAPERKAEQMLNDLRQGRVDAAMARVLNPVSREIPAKERQYPLRRWKLVNRVDETDAVTLYYRTDRVSGYLDTDAVISMEHRKGDWQIRNYLPMY